MPMSGLVCTVQGNGHQADSNSQQFELTEPFRKLTTLENVAIALLPQPLCSKLNINVSFDTKGQGSGLLPLLLAGGQLETVWSNCATHCPAYVCIIPAIPAYHWHHTS